MKLLRILYVISLAIVLLLPGCKPKKAGNFTFQLAAKYGSQNFTVGAANVDPQSRRIQIDLLKFYLAHITLVKTDNSEVELKSVALFNLADPNSLTFNVSDVDGDFKAIKFGCGVDAVQNLTDPLSVSSDNPLSSDNLMYWSMLKYRFHILEARCDTTSSGSGAFNWFPRYHIGGNAQYRQTEILKDFSVCCDNKYTLKLVLDVEKIFYGSTQTIDIITEADTQTGASDNPVIAPKFADNFSESFTIE